MDVRALVKEIHERVKDGGFAYGESCVGIGPYNWVFRHPFPAKAGLYWFYIDEPVDVSTERKLKAKDVVYIGMTTDGIAGRLADHMETPKSDPSGLGHPSGVGDAWKFETGNFFRKCEAQYATSAALLDLVRTGRLWVGWYLLQPPTDNPNAIESFESRMIEFESRMIEFVRKQDGAMPIFNVKG